MSRIAKIPVTIAKGVTVAITEADVTVKGPVGEVKMHILPLVKVTEENGHLHFEQLDESRDANMNVGTMRALVNDMVKGCSAGFEKRLTLVGVGFRAQAQGDKLNLQLGFSQTAGSFLGAAVVGLLALKAIHWFHAPNIILTIPSAIPMIPGVLLYRVLFALLNIQDITASTLLAMMRNGVEAVTIIIGIAIGVAIPNIFIHRYIENNKQRTVKDLLDKRYLKDDE